MTKPEWGTKRTCQSCNARFYDMKKKPPVCPKCEAVFELPSTPKSRKAKALAEAEKAKANEKKKKVIEDINDIEDIEVDSDDNNSVIEDIDDLEDDLNVELVVDIEKEDIKDDQ